MTTWQPQQNYTTFVHIESQLETPNIFTTKLLIWNESEQLVRSRTLRDEGCKKTDKQANNCCVHSLSIYFVRRQVGFQNADRQNISLSNMFDFQTTNSFYLVWENGRQGNWRYTTPKESHKTVNVDKEGKSLWWSQKYHQTVVFSPFKTVHCWMCVFGKNQIL